MIHLIETTADLEQFCRHLSQQEFITVDLEFLREKTYYAKLCLIQIGTKEQAAAVDPLAQELNLQPFFDILANPDIVKVFHSGRQDIEILYYLTGQIPASVFDTQVAAMVFGFGESVSYESLVKSIVKQDIDKSCRFTNWSCRPLNLKQLEYALSDVTHLVPIYLHFKELLDNSHRESWFQEEIDVLTSPDTYNINPEDAWQKIKHRSHNAYFLTVLQKLAAWREKRAQHKNTPRQSVIKDECLLNIAASMPKTHEELAQVRNIRKDIVSGRLADEIITIIKDCENLPRSSYVKLPKDKGNGAVNSALFELLKLLLKIKSQETGVVSKLIASDDELRRLTVFQDKNNPVLKGWRYEIFGKDALRLREGNLSISFNKENNSINLTATTA